MNRSKWTQLLLFFGIVCFIFWTFEREWKLKNNHRYTVAVTIGQSTVGWVDFEFEVNGQLYKRSDNALSLKSKHAKYFVRYYAPDPSVLAKIVSDEEVPDCIGVPPTNGWKELPVCK